MLKRPFELAHSNHHVYMDLPRMMFAIVDIVYYSFSHSIIVNLNSETLILWSFKASMPSRSLQNRHQAIGHGSIFF
jgi:hypothetical protein